MSRLKLRIVPNAKRDEVTGDCYMTREPFNHIGPRTRQLIPDRETKAKKELAAIMAHYSGLRAYIQGDPRGCPLYILRYEDIGNGCVDEVYTRGVAVCSKGGI